ncbi:hypothetical protein FACS189483_08440 [Spirochaetia bacterium]|nr:hypothetical protein FACS189483_08440 [Spirochaetia bacterium]
MRAYFEAVTLGAFSLRDAAKNGRFITLIREMKWPWVLLHFCIITIALGFPVTLIIARLPPNELFTRLYGENFLAANPDGAAAFNLENSGVEPLNSFPDIATVADFNTLMLQNGYGRNVLLPLLGMASGIVLILQIAFYALAAFFIRLSRINTEPLTFRERLALLLFSSTLPVLLAALFGLYLPTVHIIVFYFAVILLGFYRSKVTSQIT